MLETPLPFLLPPVKDKTFFHEAFCDISHWLYITYSHDIGVFDAIALCATRRTVKRKIETLPKQTLTL
jgi:hypothetical protein